MFKNSNKIFFLFSFLFFLGILLILPGSFILSQESYQVTKNGGRGVIDAHGVCRVVINNRTDYDVFVPVRSSEEWFEFRLHYPPGIELHGCMCIGVPNNTKVPGCDAFCQACQDEICGAVDGNPACGSWSTCQDCHFELCADQGIGTQTRPICCDGECTCLESRGCVCTRESQDGVCCDSWSVCISEICRPTVWRRRICTAALRSGNCYNDGEPCLCSQFGSRHVAAFCGCQPDGAWPRRRMECWY